MKLQNKANEIIVYPILGFLFNVLFAISLLHLLAISECKWFLQIIFSASQIYETLFL